MPAPLAVDKTIDHSRTDTKPDTGITWGKLRPRYILLGDGDIIQNGDEVWTGSDWGLMQTGNLNIRIDESCRDIIRRAFPAR